MNFIYRIPLFDFDINNLDILKKHRKQILSAIQLSSPCFVEKLRKHSFEDLDQSSFLKLKKYLIRGRYRPTPFGEFAACGMAEFGYRFSKPIQIETEEIKSEKTISQADRIFTNSYQSIPGIHTFLDHYQGIIFEPKLQKWMLSNIPKNSLMDSISNTPINFQKFSEMFESSIPNAALRPEIQSLWEELIESGFLGPICNSISPLSRSKINQEGKDFYSKTTLKIDPHIDIQLKTLMNEIGHLFQKEESKYLSGFKNWFSDKYEDRHCSLEKLLTDAEFLSQVFLQDNINQSPDSKLDFAKEFYLKNKQQNDSIDLQEIYEPSSLPKEIYDIQFLYRLDKKGKPIIENMVCNRPFVYIGRFSRSCQIFNLSKQVSENIYQDSSILYASLDLFESDSINHICDTSNPFKYHISPFLSDSSKNLQFSDLYIGIEKNRLFLSHQSGKQVNPVVLHPLNGSQITHPIMRLLWELAHQDRFRFKPFASELYHLLPNKPKLYWKETCLQTQKWVLKHSENPHLEKLKGTIQKRRIPKVFLAGTQDQELLLDINDNNDLKILFNELQKRKTLTISDCPWIYSEHFQNEKKENLYPQFVFQYSRKANPILPKYPFNPIINSQPNCIYLIIPCPTGKLEDLLISILQTFNKFQEDKSSLKWFFIQYPKHKYTEIRLRILDLSPKEKDELSIRFMKYFEKEKLHWRTETYFPETLKYGEKSLPISHELFHIESLFLSQESKNKEMNIGLSETEKLKIIIQLWKCIFLQSDFKNQYFQELKKLVKAFEHKKKTKFQKEFLDYINSSYLNPPSKNQHQFPVNSYHHLIQNHEFYLKGKNSQYILLFNHLHMMVNRFFPNETKLHEEKTWYFLYREMGRVLFTNIKSKETQNHKIRILH